MPLTLLADSMAMASKVRALRRLRLWTEVKVACSQGHIPSKIDGDTKSICITCHNTKNMAGSDQGCMWTPKIQTFSKKKARGLPKVTYCPLDNKKAAVLLITNNYR